MPIGRSQAQAADAARASAPTRRTRTARPTAARQRCPGRGRCSRSCEPLLEDPAIEKVGHDLKFDTIVLARHGVALDGLGLDTMLASYLLDATRSGHPLEAAALEHLGYKALTEEDVCGRGAKAVALRRHAAGSAR